MEQKHFTPKALLLKALSSFLVFAFLFSTFAPTKAKAGEFLGRVRNKDFYNSWATKIFTEILSLKDSDGVELISTPTKSTKDQPVVDLSSIQLIDGETYTMKLKATNTGTSESKDYFGRNPDKGYVFLLLNEKEVLTKKFPPLRQNHSSTIEVSFVAKSLTSKANTLRLRTFLMYDASNFLGDFELENEFTFSLMPNEVDVFFKKQLGDEEVSGELQTAKIPHGSKVTGDMIPALSEEVDYQFEGWFKEGETTPFVFDTPITESTTLIAKFSPKMKILYEPQVSDVEIFYLDEVKTANEYILNISDLQAAGVLKDLNFKDVSPVSTELGTKEFAIKAVYQDDSFDEVFFSFTVKPLSEKLTPVPASNLSLFWGEELSADASDYVENLTELGSVKSIAFKSSTNSTKVSSPLIVPIVVTYVDGSEDEVNVTLTVKPLSEKYSPVGKKVEYFISNPQPEISAFIEAKEGEEALPASAQLSLKEAVDWAKPASLTPIVLVTYEDGSIDEVESVLEVKEVPHYYYFIPETETKADTAATDTKEAENTSENKKEETTNVSEKVEPKEAVEEASKAIEETSEVEVETEKTALGEAKIESSTKDKKVSKKADKKDSDSIGGKRKHQKNSDVTVEEDKTPLGKLSGKRAEDSSKNLAVTGGEHNRLFLMLSIFSGLLLILGGIGLYRKKGLK